MASLVAFYQAERTIMNGQQILQMANDIYGEQEASTYWVYGSVYRPISSAWARIPNARYVNAEKSTGVHTWVVVPAQIERAVIDSYELTPEPVYGPITEEQQTQRLIARECAVWDELRAIPIPCEDEPVHTNEYPFCDDIMCPCRADFQLIREYVYQPVQDGLLTAAEGTRIYNGEQL